MRDDYQVSRGWHHVLVGVALVAAVVADLAIGVSPTEPIFSVLLLGARGVTRNNGQRARSRRLATFSRPAAHAT